MDKTENMTMRSFVRKFTEEGKTIVIALFSSYLFLYSTVKVFWLEHNRFFFQWKRTDALGVFLAILVLAGLFYVIYKLFHNAKPFWKLSFKFVFVCIMTFSFKDFVFKSVEEYANIGGWWNIGAKCLMVCIVIMSLFKLQKAVQIIKAICLIGSPILLIYVWTLLTARPYESAFQKESANGKSNSPPVKVCIIVFDEWSYAYTFGEGLSITDYPNLSKLVDRSIVFHNAKSPSIITAQSMPSLICGVSDISVLKPMTRTLYFNINGKLYMPDDMDNVFVRMKRHGYKTTLVGWHLPYAELFRNGVDDGESISQYRLFPDNPVTIGASIVITHIVERFPPVPFITEMARRIRNNYFLWMAEHIQERIESELLDDKTDFSLFHHPAPHIAYIFDVNGLAPSAHRYDFMREEMMKSAYHGNLRYVDSLIGDTIKAMDSSVVSNRTLLILTSDHSYRRDIRTLYPNRDSDDYNKIRHVPLIICLPGQRERVDVSIPFHTEDLVNVLDAYLDTDLSKEEFLRLCEKAKEIR